MLEFAKDLREVINVFADLTCAMMLFAIVYLLLTRKAWKTQITNGIANGVREEIRKEK